MCWHTLSPIEWERAITDMDRRYALKLSMDVTPEVDVEHSRAQPRALAGIKRGRRPSSIAAGASAGPRRLAGEMRRLWPSSPFT
jgi:hypothetical protein